MDDEVGMHFVCDGESGARGPRWTDSMLPENVSEIKQLGDNASGERIAPIHAQNKAVELILKIVGTLPIQYQGYCTGCCAVRM